MAVQNEENGMVWGGYAAFKVIGNVKFNRNYAAILYRFRNLAQHDGKMSKLLQ